ncbi:hypothetical protein [Kitasatospora aureofaciens]|nr:hypothetical protein [Kitasatospora aureofaciens]
MSDRDAHHRTVAQGFELRPQPFALSNPLKLPLFPKPALDFCQ